MLALANHWDRLLGEGDEASFGWFEPTSPTLDDLRELVTIPAAIIDVGAGTGRLADRLLADGHTDITLVDLSANALDVATGRLGDSVEALVADVTDFHPGRTWDLWHDRAVFHFLVDDADREAYLEAARRSIRPGGHLVVATFALDGPESCAGLPVRRHDEVALAAAFADGFDCLGVRRYAPGADDHDRRPYVIGRFRRLG